MDMFDKLNVYSSNIAIIDENLETFTYKDLLISADELGKNVAKRTTIFLICKNSYEFVVSYVGLIRTKAVVFLINNSINEKKLNYLVNHYRPKYILIPKEKNISSVGLIEKFNLNNKYKLFETNFRTKQVVHAELALLMTTSGSTGSPKFVTKLCWRLFYKF